jgi:hypothetical protein
MTEEEYIDATNLAKLRMAVHALGNTIRVTEQDKAAFQKAIEPLDEWVGRLEKKVKTRG